MDLTIESSWAGVVKIAHDRAVQGRGSADLLNHVNRDFPITAF
jgi:hypothetical protein